MNKNRKIFLTNFLLALSFLKLSAQEMSRLYYDVHWNPCTQKVSSYIKEVRTLRGDSGFYVKVYEVEKDPLIAAQYILKMEGRYLSLDPETEHGVFHFYKIGGFDYEGAYEKGSMTGVWKQFNKKGKLVKWVNYTVDTSYVPRTVLVNNSLDSSKGAKEANEVLPAYGNGQSWAGMQEFIGKNTEYPPMAILYKQQGKVTVGFIVHKDGVASSFKVLDASHKDLGTEAVRIVSSMPYWIPGTMRGRPVSVKMTIPLKFRLSF